MTLLAILLVLVVAASFACPLERLRPGSSRELALLAQVFALLLLCSYLPQTSVDLATTSPHIPSSPLPSAYWDAVQWLWIPRFGISFHLAMDGLSFLMLSLTLGAGLFGLAITGGQIKSRIGFFHCNYLLVLAGVVGVFTAVDLFLFFFFWEVMLVPMLLLIAIWGYENRTYAAIKFFIFTQASSLLMLAAIIALVYTHYQTSGELTFALSDLLQGQRPQSLQFWLMLGFFLAFAVKLPAVPLHPWLPDAHTQAPTAASILLAALLLKTGAYGLLRFTLPLFPDASRAFATVAMSIGALGTLYGALMAFSQRDVKRLVAYSSVSHMGFVLLGIFSFNALAMQGAVIQILAHGISSAALFAIVGKLQQRLHTRDMTDMGGLWTEFPRLGATALFFTMAAIGLPGLGNFVGEFLVLAGAFRAHPLLTALAALGLIGAALYGLGMLQRVFFGGLHSEHASTPDIARRSVLVFAGAALLLCWIGLYPQPLVNQAQPWLTRIVELPLTDQGAAATAEVQ